MKKILNSLCNRFLPFLSAGIILLAGCAKKEKQITEIGEKVDMKVPGIMAYYNFLNKKTDGVFAIKNYTTKAMQYENRN